MPTASCSTDTWPRRGAWRASWSHPRTPRISSRRPSPRCSRCCSAAPGLTSRSAPTCSPPSVASTSTGSGRTHGCSRPTTWSPSTPACRSATPRSRASRTRRRRRPSRPLPERWQAVLWHTEVEGQKPAEVAVLLGMSANSVSALAYRAREGLRQAFLTMHLQELEDDTCAWTHQNLGAYVRNGISRRDAAKVEHHLTECRRCSALYLELTEVNSNLSGLLAPLLLGSAAAMYAGSDDRRRRTQGRAPAAARPGEGPRRGPRAGVGGGRRRHRSGRGRRRLPGHRRRSAPGDHPAHRYRSGAGRIEHGSVHEAWS